jgi:hypothetical protein
MRKLLTLWIALVALAFAVPASAQLSGGLMFPGPGMPASSGGSGCTAATNFLARTSGLSGTETTAYTTMICGLVTDGVITGTMNGANSGSGACGSTLDALYIFATNSTTTANLNLCGTSYGLTQTGTITFSADHGYTGNGSTGVLDTGFIPSSATTPNFVQNSGSVGAYVLTNRTVAQNYISLGSGSGSSYRYVQPLIGSTTAGVELNGGTFGTVAATTAQGLLVASRTNSSNISAFRNNSSTDLGPSTDASSSVTSDSIKILALNNNGVATDFSADQIAAAYIGAGVSGATHVLIANRINAYMTALSINVY